MPRRKLSDEEAQALVLAGLKGEVAVAELCRRHAVSEVTYYKLRDRFMASEDPVSVESLDFRLRRSRMERHLAIR